MIEIALGKPRNAGILVTVLRANGQELDITVGKILAYDSQWRLNLAANLQ